MVWRVRSCSGFLDLQANQAQNRFYNELEEWLADITHVETTAGENTAQVRFALIDMQRALTDLGERLQDSVQASAMNGTGSDEAVKELAGGIEKLVRQMRAEQKVVREWVDEQATQQAELSQVLRQLQSQLNGRG